MRLILAVCILLCLAMAGFGVRLVLEQEKQLQAFSEQTTATVLGTRVETTRNDRGPKIKVSYQPRVKYRFEAGGRDVTSDEIFPNPFSAGGNLGRLTAKSYLDGLKAGEKTRVYYNPTNPAESCLIRRPSLLLYLTVLVPIIVASGLVLFAWRSRKPNDVEFNRRKARWITALWYLAGLATIAHYFQVAGYDFESGAVVVFGLYAQLGLIPLAFAFPPSHSSHFSRRVKGVIGFSIFGTFAGFWIGLLLGYLGLIFFSAKPSTFFQVWHYTIAIVTAASACLALIGRAESDPPPDIPLPPEIQR